MTAKCRKDQDFVLFKLDMINRKNGYKYVSDQQPIEISHVDNNKFSDVINIINNDMYRFTDVEWHVYYHMATYVLLQIVIYSVMVYKYFVYQNISHINIILASLLMMTNIWINDLYMQNLKFETKLIIDKINHNIERYRKKNDFQWRFEIFNKNNVHQLYLKYYIYRCDHEYDDDDDIAH